MSNNLSINIEQIKKEKDGLDVLGDIYIHAIFGEKISPENLERFKWYGLYPQDKEQNLFELKIPLSMGELNIKQIKVLNQIIKNYSNNKLEILAKQKISIKNIKLHDLPEIFNLLQEVGLNTSFEAGHTVRRVLTCPVNGLDTTQLFDVSELANKLNETFIGNKKFSNLPNKLQMAISGYEEGCDVQFVPDVSFNATKNDKDKIIFAVKILDKVIGYILPSMVVKTAIAIANIYKDFGNRTHQSDTSFEYLVKNWGFEEFFNILDSTINYKLQKTISTKNERIPVKPRMGIHKSKIEKQSYIGCKIDFNILESSNLESLLNTLEEFGATKIKITHKKNIVILDAQSKDAEIFAKELQKIGFNPFV